MKKFIKVRGSRDYIPPLEINVDTVYVRYNVSRVESEDFTGWEYDEVQYGLKEYIEVVGTENENLKTTQLETNALVLDLMESLSK